MNRDDTRLTLRDVPVFLWIFGLIFAGVGAAMFYEGARAPFMALIMSAIGLSALLFTSVLTITADRITRTLTLGYRSVLLRSSKQFPFDDIAGINLERSVSHSKGSVSYTYQVTLKLKDGKVVPFRSYASSGSKRKERQVNQLREFIGVQGYDSSPSGMLQLRADEIHETNGVHWQAQTVAAGVRWHSPDFVIPGAFLLIAQKAEGQATGGFLASLGTMIFKQSLSLWGFNPDDTPGLDQATTMEPLDPALEPHFMAFTSAPASAGRMLNPAAVAALANWAAHHPLKQFQKASNCRHVVILFGPSGVYLATMNLARPDQVDELAALGAELVKSQIGSRSGS